MYLILLVFFHGNTLKRIRLTLLVICYTLWSWALLSRLISVIYLQEPLRTYSYVTTDHLSWALGLSSVALLLKCELCKLVSNADTRAPLRIQIY